MISQIIKIACFCGLFGPWFASTAWGWGSRGHTVVTRVAVRQLLREMGPDRSLSGTFLDKESVLSHLSLVPDIVWRNGDPTVSALNSPMHYYDLEYVAKSPQDLRELPVSLEAQTQILETLCRTPPDGYLCPAEPNSRPTAGLAGSAPFRVVQLFQKLTNAFKEAKSVRHDQGKGPKHPSFAKAVNEALLYAGLLSHYIADLANPYHVTRDYDGHEHRQGGVHEYFEQTLVNELDLSLDAKVLEKTRTLTSLSPLKKHLKANGAVSSLNLPQVVTLGLILDSFQQLSRARDLDRRVAVVKLGQGDHGLKVSATRHPAAKVHSSFEPLITDRLAIGAAVLAHLWREAWIEAGRPDLTDFRSFEFPLAPAFFAL